VWSGRRVASGWGRGVFCKDSTNRVGVYMETGGSVAMEWSGARVWSNPMSPTHVSRGMDSRAKHVGQYLHEYLDAWSAGLGPEPLLSSISAVNDPPIVKALWHL
jgi:hypothetical protein